MGGAEGVGPDPGRTDADRECGNQPRDEKNEVGDAEGEEPSNMATSAEIERQFEQEEQAYWKQRPQLMEKHRGKWVAIVDGKVAAVGTQMNKTAAEAYRKTGNGVMFVALVGDEDVEFHIRRTQAGHFEPRYQHPMPMVTTSLTDIAQSAQVQVEFIIDTGADITLVRNDVANQLNLRRFPAGWARIGGFDGRLQRRRLYSALVHIATQAVLVTTDCRNDISEDILGRDVTNEFALTLCAKRDQVEFEWVEEP
jgi:hypothetical protein